MIKHIPFENIDPNPWQTRLVEDPEHITALMDSIKQDGLLQIPTGRPMDGPEERVQLAFGHSRVEACRRLHALGLFPPNFPLNLTDLTDEEMFRWSITENNSRKDLTPIEVARAMQIYRDDFDKSSHEIGQLFQLSDSAVRNKVRLLELPQETQYQVERGALTESAARSLLQLQRFSPDKVAEVTRRAVEERLTSEEVVHCAVEEIQHQDHSKTMSPSWSDGPPKGGTDLWLLRDWIPDVSVDDKEFINQIFVRLMTAVREEEIEVADPKRAPAHWVDYSLEFFEGMLADYFNRPDQWAELYAGYGFRFLAVFRALVDQQHTCSACPFYIVNAGTHYCGVKHCWEWRQDRYLLEEGIRLSAELGVQLYEEADGRFTRIADFSGWQTSDAGRKKVEALFEKWQAAGDPRLRLKQYSRNYQTFKITNHPFWDVVCIGSAIKEAEKAYQAGLKEDIKNEQEKAGKPTEWEINNAKKQASQEFMDAEVIPVFKTLFADLHHQLLIWYFSDEYHPPADENVLKEFTIRFIRQGLALEEKVKGPTAVAKHLAGLAKTIGLDLPKDWLDRAAAFEPKFEDPSDD